MSRRPVRFFVASAGNEFMAHIAELFAEGCRAAGAAAEVIVDGVPLDHADQAWCVVVAPHEYFPLHFLRSRPTIELGPTLRRVAVLNVEQPGSTWFETAWELARDAADVFDISPAGIAEFGRRGIGAVLTPLGFAPSLEATHGPPLASRPIDVLFLGHNSRRRSAFFARHAEAFSAINCHVVLTEVRRPRAPATAGYRAGEDRLRLIADSRIVLSVHSTPRQYFEQHRAALALANGTALITETSQHTAPLVAGTHFLSADLEDLPQLCRRVLEDGGMLEQVAAAGAAAVRTLLPMRLSGATILDRFESRTCGSTAPAHDRRAEIRQRLRESLAMQDSGEAAWRETTNAAYSTGDAPGITVLVTLFDYEQYVDHCLASVLAATPPVGGLEIVVVDDGSTDSGPQRVEATMAAAPVPMLLARKTLNSGLADARNVGLRLARGRHVFILDADNWIYPSCLVTLQEALASNGALAGVYGEIARVEQETGQAQDLISCLDWDPARLVEGPYIDAMALLDRSTVLRLGGYSTELIDHGWFGWEDYDLWLKFARAGHGCRLVPRIVAGYRDHGASMLRRTNRDSARLADYFKSKFADLLERYPDSDTWFGFPARAPERLTPEEREIRLLRGHATALERQLADVYTSRSWRITAPLRAALRRLAPRK